jgi:hypothetical protein
MNKDKNIVGKFARAKERLSPFNVAKALSERGVFFDKAAYDVSARTIMNEANKAKVADVIAQQNLGKVA